jgi:hypothetical protein
MSKTSAAPAITGTTRAARTATREFAPPFLLLLFHDRAFCTAKFHANTAGKLERLDAPA